VFDVLVGTTARAASSGPTSAPFAAEAYAKEIVELADGSNSRAYPRLEHGGAHLRDPASERGPDIAARLIGGILLGIGMAMVQIAAVVVSLCARAAGMAWNTTAMSHGAW
jgi:peptide/nickel transport system permease protein